MKVLGAFGPILTTGVALSAAVMAVINPVTAPNADVRIPAAQAQISKSGGQAVDMLDEDFINAVGPGPAGSTNPLAVLTDLVGTLVGNAAELGEEAVLRAFFAGASVVSGQEVPELTAVVYPYVPPTPDILPVLPWPALPGPVAEDLRPVVEQALTAIIADSGDVAGAGVVAAAYLAGAALAAGESPILATVRGLVDSQLQPTVEKVGSAISALPHPVILIGQAVERILPSLPTVVDVPVRLGRDTDSGAGLPAGVVPSVGDEAASAPRRQASPIAAEPTPPPLLSAVAADLPAVDDVAPKRPFSVRPTDAHAGGAIGRAVKAHMERTRS